MVIGYFGVGSAAKAGAPHVSLGALFLAAQWSDLLWPTLLLPVIYASNPFGPPPPGVEAVAWTGQARWPLAALGRWFNSHRRIATVPRVS